jgi:hypothetical protein
MHAEVVHDAGLTAVLDLALPVDWLRGIDIAGVQESAASLDDRAKRTGLHIVDSPLGPGVERHLARAAHEALRMLGNGGKNRIGSSAIDAERLLGKQALAGVDDIDVHLLVQVVADGHVDDIN